jgi:hypothetical protein
MSAMPDACPPVERWRVPVVPQVPGRAGGGAPPGEGDEEDPLEDDGSDEPEREPTGREKDAKRAFLGAVFGLLFFPLQFYVSYLLLRVLFSTEALGGRSRGRARVAAAINVPFMLLLGVVLFAIWNS